MTSETDFARNYFLIISYDPGCLVMKQLMENCISFISKMSQKIIVVLYPIVWKSLKIFRTEVD